MLRILAEEGLETAGVLAAAGLRKGAGAARHGDAGAGIRGSARCGSDRLSARSVAAHRVALSPAQSAASSACAAHRARSGEMAETSPAHAPDYSLARITPIHQHGALVGHEIDIRTWPTCCATHRLSRYRRLTTVLRDVWNAAPIGRTRRCPAIAGRAWRGLRALRVRRRPHGHTERRAQRGSSLLSDEALHAAYLAECRSIWVRGAKDDLVDMLARSLTGAMAVYPSAPAAEPGWSAPCSAACRIAA